MVPRTRLRPARTPVLAGWLGVLAAALPAQDAVQSRAAQIVQNLMQAHGLPGVVVGVVDHGRTSRWAFGATTIDGAPPADAGTEYEIGSVTKVFTATLLALSVERGVVALDDPLQKWVPPNVRVPTFQGRAITLEDLATHTSGFPDDPPMDGIAHFRDANLWAFVNRYELPYAPGSRWAYSNTGFALLGHALQRAAGVPWPELVVRDVCAPLGMPDTKLRLSPAEESRFAKGYGPKGNPAPVAMKSWPAFWSAGALRSTLVDMTRFLEFNLGMVDTPLKTLLPILQKVRRPGLERAQMALGWQVLPSMPERRIPGPVYFKNGGTDGFHAFIAFVPGTQCGVVFVTNKAYRLDGEAFDLLGFIHREGANPAATSAP